MSRYLQPHSKCGCPALCCAWNAVAAKIDVKQRWLGGDRGSRSIRSRAAEYRPRRRAGAVAGTTMVTGALAHPKTAEAQDASHGHDRGEGHAPENSGKTLLYRSQIGLNRIRPW
jgi:hypothetical protein